MSYIISISRFDTALPIKITVKRTYLGTARDITGARVFMSWYKDDKNKTHVLTKEGSVISGADGKAQFSLVRKDTWNLAVGKYFAKFRILLSDGTEFRVPKLGWQTINFIE